MPGLTIYKLRPSVEGRPVTDFDDYIQSGRTLDIHGPVESSGFVAKLYVMKSHPQRPRWAGFVVEGFGDDVDIPARRGLGALVLVKVQIRDDTHYFALPFGPTGRFILEESSIQRSYGLRTALNLIYPKNVTELDVDRMISVDAKRRQKDLLRSRVQSSRATTFETFDVDQLRDVLDAATGRPANPSEWGRRLSGADPLSLSVDVEFEDLGELCTRIERTHRKTDYRQRFAWLDNIQPVADPDLVGRLEIEVIENLVAGDLAELDLAPPQIVDWTLVDDFRFAVETPRTVRHPDLRLHEYVAALRKAKLLDDLSPAQLRHTNISALDANGDLIHRWTAWKCLTGSVTLRGKTFILDEGEFFSVATDFLAAINDFIDGIDEGVAPLPDFQVGWDEGQYNDNAAQVSTGLLLLDKDTISTSAATTPVEVCDILTAQKELIHVKRELGSRDLSHLFSQGIVSAELIQVDLDFRSAVQTKVKALAGSDNFAFFGPGPLATSDFRVTYAVVANWRDRTPSQALPFFSKLNLRRTVQDLRNRGFLVGFRRINSTHPATGTSR